MATHITCHSNETMPNRFPPPRPTPRDHGMLSDYEKGHVTRQWKPTIQPEVEGGISLPQDEDSEALPRTYHKPAPITSQTADLRSMLDPTLCLTPEKTSKTALKSKKNAIETSKATENSNTNTKTMSPKVRFEQQVTVQFLSPEREPQEDIIEIDRSDDTEQELSFTDPVPVDSEGTSDEEERNYGSDTRPKKYHYQTYSGDLRDSDQGIQDIVSKAECINIDQDNPSSNQATQCNSDKGPALQKVAQPSRKTQSHGAASQQLASDAEIIDVIPQKMAAEKTSLMAMGDSEHDLARPEFNSTLFMSKEVRKVAEQQFNAVAAARVKLERSTRVRSAIDEKTYSHLNTEIHQFPGLVGIGVREEDLLESAARELTSKVKPTNRSKAQRPEDQITRPPDIMDFFTPDLQREVPSFTLHGLPPVTNSLCTADQRSAFDIYRHIRAWEDW